MPNTDAFRSELRARLAEADSRSAPHVEINAGELHRAVGGYPGPNHRMPACCDAMYAEQRSGDAIVTAPARGKGASLTIRYGLPR